MTPDLDRLQAFCDAEQAWQIATIEALTRLESPSYDKAAVDRCGTDLARRLADLGGRVSTIAQQEAGDHLRVEFGPRLEPHDRVEPGGRAGFPEGIDRGHRGDPGHEGEPGHESESGARGVVQVLLLGHFDTVWPRGTLAEMPLVHADGRLHGPGTFDMKAGIAIGMLATRALTTLAPDLPLRIVMLWTTDEEVGSRSSRALIEAEARKSRAVLVLEPSLPQGAVKTSRKGVGEFTLDVRGVAAHSGIDPGKGVSAVHELAHLVTALAPLNDLARGTSVNVGVFEGGTRSNVVAERARALVDVRVPTAAEARRVDAFVRALVPKDPRARITIAGGVDRPPLERSPDVVRLYALARDVARGLGRELGEGGTGGGSDGNFTAAIGVPTLDGLGAVGDGAHARHEHVETAALGWRSALVAGLMARLAER